MAGNVINVSVRIDATDSGAAAKLDALKAAAAELGIQFQVASKAAAEAGGAATTSFAATGAAAVSAARAVHELTAAEAEQRVAAQAHNAALLAAARQRQGVGSRVLSAEQATAQVAARAENERQLAAARSRLGLSSASKEAAAGEGEFSAAASAGFAVGGKLLGVLGALTAGYLSLKGAVDLAREGLEYLSRVDQERLGIAAEVRASATLGAPGGGPALPESQQFGAALVVADDQMKKLQADAIATGINIESLQQNFTQVAAAGLRAGITLDNMRGITTQLSVVARSLGINYDEMGRTILQLLSGHAQIRNRMIAVLGITQQDLAVARQRGEVAQFLNEKIAAYNVLVGATANTVAAIEGRLAAGARLFASQAVEPLDVAIETKIGPALGKAFDGSTGAFAPAIQKVITQLQTVFKAAGDILAKALDAAVHGAGELSQWFDKNGVALGTIASGMVGMVGSLASVIGSTIRWAAETEAVHDAFTLVAAGVKLVNDELKKGIEVAKEFAGLMPHIPDVSGLGGGIGPLIQAARDLSQITAAQAAPGEADTRAAERTAQLGEQTATLIKLGAEYDRLGQQINSGKLTPKELLDAQKQLDGVLKQLVESGVNEGAVVAAAANSHKSFAQMLRDEAAATEQLIGAQVQRRVTELAQAEQDRDQLISKARKAGTKFVTAADGTATPVFANAFQNLKHGGDQLIADLDAASKRVADALRNLATARSGLVAVQGARTDFTVTPKPVAPPEKFGDDAKIAEGKLREIAEATKADLQQIDDAYKQSQLSIHQYYTEKSAIEQEGLQQEIDVKTRLLYAQGITPAERARTLEDIQTLEEQRLAITQHNSALEAEARAALAKELEGLDVAALKAQGRNLDASILETQRKYSALLAKLKAEGDAQGAAKVQLIEQADIRGAQGKDLTDQAAQAKQELQQRLDAIKVQVDLGTLTKGQGAEQIAQAYQDAADKVRTLADQLERLGITTSDQRLISDAQRLRTEYGQLTVEIAKTQGAAETFGKTLEAIGTKTLDSLFTTDFSQARRGFDALHHLALGVSNDIRKGVSDPLKKGLNSAIDQLLHPGGRGAVPQLPIPTSVAQVTGQLDRLTGGGAAGPASISTGATQLSAAGLAVQQGGASILAGAQALAAAALELQVASGASAAGGGGGGGGGPAGAFGALASAAMTAAAGGGWIRGAGSSTSDSIPAMLSHGEYVLKADVVKSVGVPALDRLNFRRGGGVSRAYTMGGSVPHFAGGGAIATPSTGPVGPGESHLYVHHDRGLILEVMSSSEGQKIHIENTGRNAKRMQTALRIPGAQG